MSRRKFANTVKLNEAETQSVDDRSFIYWDLPSEEVVLEIHDDVFDVRPLEELKLESDQFRGPRPPKPTKICPVDPGSPQQ